MKKTLIVVFAALMAGCSTPMERAEYSIKRDGLPVVVIEGCQYFVFTGYASTMTYEHKGNCNNPIHKTSTK